MHGRARTSVFSASCHSVLATGEAVFSLQAMLRRSFGMPSEDTCSYTACICCVTASYQPVLLMHRLTSHIPAQVLGRNLEALVTRAQDIKADWKDEFVSVEHMLLAFLDDAKFGTNLLKGANLDRAKLEAAVKEVRGSNRVTDQVCCASSAV